MQEILERIGSYNIFNFLLPGVVFSVLASRLTNYQLVQDDAIVGAFFYYFVGLVISRIGSLIVEPILKATKVVTFSAYEDFVAASKDDSKFEVLSETNNMYRTLSSLFICLAALSAFGWVCERVSFVKSSTPAICILGLIALFILSYRKQTKYIENRISANRK